MHYAKALVAVSGEFSRRVKIPPPSIQNKVNHMVVCHLCGNEISVDDLVHRRNVVEFWHSFYHESCFKKAEWECKEALKHD
jgi:hypothetical protein